ncbi:hypothetical protein BH23GEM2_BH23GEM2_26300 [soil metagenome]
MQSSNHVRAHRAENARHPVIVATFLLCVGSALNCSTDAAAPSEPYGAIANAAGGANTIVVSSAAELVAALSPENAGRKILVRAGSYGIAQLLTVPDGVTLEGEGVMQFDGDGVPTGFASGTRTTVTMTANTPGNLLTLGDRVTVRRLEIADLPGRAGHVIAVVSRDAGDRVSATIAESEIHNPSPAAFYGLAVITNNLNLGADPPPHEGATLTARMVRSVIRAPVAGGGVFAFNFAPRGRISITLAGNAIGGGINANGGVSLPDAVHDARVEIESHRNLYRDDRLDPCASARLGWNLTGGSGPPAPLSVAETARNTLRVYSLDDRIEGFTRAILATGSRRFFPLPIAGPSTDNTLDLELVGGRISTPSCAGAPFVRDLDLAGAFAANDALFPGDGNRLRALVRGVTGSGPRFNQYANARGPSGSLPLALQGSGNRLTVIGSPQAFARTNRAIDPAPGAEFFSSAGK